MSSQPNPELSLSEGASPITPAENPAQVENAKRLSYLKAAMAVGLGAVVFASLSVLNETGRTRRAREAMEQSAGNEKVENLHRYINEAEDDHADAELQRLRGRRGEN